MTSGIPASARPSLESNLLPLVRLLQLASPALPIGAYSYSQGLEWMIDCGAIRDAAGAQRWIGDVLEWVIADGEAAVLARLIDACERDEQRDFAKWNAWHVASRETRELRAETEQMGSSLAKLAFDVGIFDDTGKALAASVEPIALPAAFALACHALRIPIDAALAGYTMSWLENQVLVSIKALPLGQVAGQKMLVALAARVPDVVARAMAIDDDDIVSFAPGFALASARHETQYSRLFRS